MSVQSDSTTESDLFARLRELDLDNDDIRAKINEHVSIIENKEEIIKQIFRVLKDEKDFFISNANYVKVVEELLNLCKDYVESAASSSRTLNSILITKCTEVVGEYAGNINYVIVIAGCRGFAEATEANFVKRENEAKRANDDIRIAPLDFKVVETAFPNPHNLKHFVKSVEALFDWFGKDNTINYNRYIAPYFPLIQSSGTGKTLLLHALKTHFDASTHIDCKLFICVKPMAKSEVHEEFFIIPKPKEGNDKIRDRIWSMLDDIVKESQKNKLVWLFDEAQGLLDKNRDAFYFRCIRWWLRKTRDRQVVAVFSGTTSKLSNYYPETVPAAAESRNGTYTYWNENVENLRFYDPFFDLITTGARSYINARENEGEYKVAAKYGRPLFAALQEGDTNGNNLLDDDMRDKILQRMLFYNTNNDYAENANALMNILGTRVQMGHVSVNLASRLVARGYAHLVGFNPRSSKTSTVSTSTINYDDDVAHISYLPDPVCAHLAMCLMDVGSSFKKADQIKGRDPKFWTQKATELFSLGICHPAKGDVGEVAAALYLLFSGDKERKRLDTNYMIFSINLPRFIARLLSPSGEIDFPSLTGKEEKTQATRSDSKYQVNFIQFVRLTFRMQLTNVCNQKTLQWMYNAACAFYLPSQSPVFDMLASIKCIVGAGQTHYIPLAVSVKSRRLFTNADVKSELDRMLQQMNDSTINGALCLLMLLDLKDKRSINLKNLLQYEDCNQDLTKKVVCKALVVSSNDDYGIGDLVQNTRPGDNRYCEVFTSHPMIASLDKSMFDEFRQNQSRYDEETIEYASQNIANTTVSKTAGAKRKKKKKKKNTVIVRNTLYRPRVELN